MRNIKTAVGLMSGTSMDGIDAALLQSDGQNAVAVLGAYHWPYAAAFRQRLQQGMAEAQTVTVAAARPGILPQLEAELTHYHAQAVQALLAAQQWATDKVDFIGFHGQTMLHRPPLRRAGAARGQNGFTLQLGDGALLARQTGIATIADMRAADMAAGGSGAPLIPVYHRALAAKLAGKCRFPLVFVNIGGIANCTYVGAAAGEQTVLAAFDCGPGNSLLDQWAEAKTGKFFDEDGQAAQAGRVLPWLAQAYAALPIFQQQRRAFDRSDFPPLEKFLQQRGQDAALPAVSYQDGAASLAFITVEQIIRSFARLPQMPKTAIISGGGAKNKAVMADLQKLAAAAGIEIRTADSVGLDSDFMEAEAWGYLAIRSFYRLPLTYPATTGCAKPVSGGVFYPAPA